MITTTQKQRSRQLATWTHYSFVTAILLCLFTARAAFAETSSFEWNGTLQITNPALGEKTLVLRYLGDHASDDELLLPGDTVTVKTSLLDGSAQMLAAQTQYRWYRAKKENVSHFMGIETGRTTVHEAGEQRGPERRFCRFDNGTIQIKTAPPAGQPDPLAKAVLDDPAGHPVYRMDLVISNPGKPSGLLAGALTCTAPTEAECKALRPAGDDWEWHPEDFKQEQPAKALLDLPDHKVFKVKISVVRVMAAQPTAP